MNNQIGPIVKHESKMPCMCSIVIWCVLNQRAYNLGQCELSSSSTIELLGSISTDTTNDRQRKVL